MWKIFKPVKKACKWMWHTTQDAADGVGSFFARNYYSAMTYLYFKFNKSSEDGLDSPQRATSQPNLRSTSTPSLPIRSKSEPVLSKPSTLEKEDEFGIYLNRAATKLTTLEFERAEKERTMLELHRENKLDKLDSDGMRLIQRVASLINVSMNDLGCRARSEIISTNKYAKEQFQMERARTLQVNLMNAQIRLAPLAKHKTNDPDKLEAIKAANELNSEIQTFLTKYQPIVELTSAIYKLCCDIETHRERINGIKKFDITTVQPYTNSPEEYESALDRYMDPIHLTPRQEQTVPPSTVLRAAPAMAV